MGHRHQQHHGKSAGDDTKMVGRDVRAGEDEGAPSGRGGDAGTGEGDETDARTDEDPGRVEGGRYSGS